jgi:hypothetical protein
MSSAQPQRQEECREPCRINEIFAAPKTSKVSPDGAAAGESGYCYFHANPGVAAQVGRLGGRQNRHFVEDNTTPLPPLNSISGVQSAIAQTITDVRSHRLPARTAAVLANLFNSQLRTFGPDDLEKRLKKREETVNARNPDKSTDKAGEN